MASPATPAPTAISTLAASASPAGTSPASTLPAGIYVTSISLDDLRGKIPEHELCENAGAFTLTFSTDGTWTLAQEAVAGCTLIAPIGTGTYRTSDGRLQMTQDDPFGCDRDFSLAFARSGATLTFSDAIDRDCIERELIYTVNPWTAK